MTHIMANPDLLSATTSSTGELEDLGELRFRLTSTLQASLDLHETLAAFYQMLQKVIRCSGMEYRMPARDIRLALGTHRTHKANYNLLTSQYAVGEMTFFRGARFSEQELSTLEGLLALLMQPLRNALLYRDALENSLRDSLTGVGNRAALELALQRELKLSQRSRRPLSLLIADMDEFKQINDQLGHAAGDQLLQQVAKAIKSALRDTDQVFRYGGEEFVVVLGNTGNSEAVAIAERIRNQIESQELSTDNGPVHATISIGVSTSTADDDRDSLFKRGDTALYQAKRSGRNCVIHHPPVVLES
jgi:diguanylate cyclase (GGDEF)-like protein